MTDEELSGHRALVTGAVGALGAAVGEELRRRGADVVGIDAQAGSEITMDISDYGQVRDRLGEFLAGQPVRILVHCAAISLEKTLEETAADEWAHILAVNASGTFHLLRILLPHMRDHGYGRIVAVGSIAARFGYAFPAYAASKAAVTALVKSAAVQFAEFGVTVNCVSPGRIATPMAPKGSEAELRERIPIGRAADAREVATVIASLVSPSASYLTGADIVCDGGMSSVFALHGLGPYGPRGKRGGTPR